jgi:DNA-binding response OmpR family regulator
MSQQKPLLLIADDDPEILSMLSLRFSKKGFEVVEAADGLETLRKARERRPDAVILDVMMPGKNGWEVARELRTDASLANVGIVMLTAIGERVNEMTSPLYGADEYVDKPFEFADLEARVKKAIERRQQLS